jgi:site-specific DNA-cytosine methylase
LSLCAGYGGIERGLKIARVPHRVITHVEIESFAIANMVDKMEAGQMDWALIHSDVKTLPLRPFRGSTDILTGGYPCFTEGHLVLTKEGHKPIEQVQLGDQVLTHKGRWRKVLSVMQKTGASTRLISHGGQHGIECTDEHPFYTRQRYRVKGERRFKQPEWTEAKDVCRDTFICDVTPVDKESDEHTEGFWELVGRWLADGYTQYQGKKGKAVFCIGKVKDEEFRNILEQSGFTAYRSEERTAIKYHITQTNFARFLDQFGKGAENKYIPGWVFGLEDSKAKSLFSGYMSGDGHREKSGYRATTVSRRLAYSLSMLGSIVLGCVPSVRLQKTPDTTVIEGRTVNQSDYYTVSFPSNNQKVFFREGNYGWRQIRYNDVCRTNQRVYNIEVEEDNSYTVNNIVVHNCQPFSMAGKRLGKEDPRHLWPYICRIIDGIMPRMCFFENVEGHISKGLLQVLKDLEERGYKTTWGVFSASEAGAPHQRKRVFIMAYKQGVRCRRRQDSDRDNPDWFQIVQANVRAMVRSQIERCSRDTGSELGNPKSDFERWIWNSEERSQESSRGSGSLRACTEFENPSDSGLRRSETTEIQGQCSVGERQHERPVERGIISNGSERPSSTSSELDNTDCQRSQGHTGSGDCSQGREDQHRPATEASIRWPARPNQQQHEWEHQRVTIKPGLGGATNEDSGRYNVTQDNRIERLRMLGNGVVPPQAAIAFLILTKQLLEENYEMFKTSGYCDYLP